MIEKKYILGRTESNKDDVHIKFHFIDVDGNNVKGSYYDMYPDLYDSIEHFAYILTKPGSFNDTINFQNDDTGSVDIKYPVNITIVPAKDK